MLHDAAPVLEGWQLAAILDDRNDISPTSTGGKRQRRNEGGGATAPLGDVSGAARWDPATRADWEFKHVVAAGVAPWAP
jgi:hypothetical protein